MDTRDWYVVYTKPNQEMSASRNLLRQGFSVYLPQYARTRRHARKTEVVARPLFPRYLFVALDLNRDPWRSVQSTFGVAGLVMTRDQPAALPQGTVEAIRFCEDPSGYVALNANLALRAGSKIKLLDGIFADHHGVLDRKADQHRVAVLLQLLGRQVRVFVESSNVIAA